MNAMAMTKRMNGNGKRMGVEVESTSNDDECQVIFENISKRPRLEVGLTAFELHKVPKDVPTTMRMWPMMFSAIVKELTPPVELRDQQGSNDPYLRWHNPLFPTFPHLRHSFILTEEERLAIIKSQKCLQEGKYSTQVRLRFCIVPDPASNDPEPDDWYPDGLTVYVNGNKIPINLQMVKAVRTTYFKPIDITRYVNKSTEPTNEVEVFWSRTNDLKVYAMNLYLCKELTVKDLIRNVIDNEWLPADKSLQRIKDLIWNDKDYADVPLMVSMKCHIKKSLLKLPGRGGNCIHHTCFDVKTFLEMNLKARLDKTPCPICRRPLKSEDLRIDELFARVLQAIEGSRVESIEICKADTVDDVLKRAQAQVRQQLKQGQDNVVVVVD